MLEARERSIPLRSYCDTGAAKKCGEIQYGYSRVIVSVSLYPERSGKVVITWPWARKRWIYIEAWGRFCWRALQEGHGEWKRPTKSLGDLKVGRNTYDDRETFVCGGKKLYVMSSWETSCLTGDLRISLFIKIINVIEKFKLKIFMTFYNLWI